MSTEAVPVRQPKPGDIPNKAIPDNIGDRVSTTAARLMEETIGAAIKEYRAGGKAFGSDLHIGSIPLGDKFGDNPMTTLAWLHNHPESEFMQKILVECSQGCGEKFECVKLFAGATACDKCREAWEASEFKKTMRDKWEKICPDRYRNTDMKHPDFPIAQYQSLTRPERWNGKSSLFLYGATGRGKTRLGMEMLKRAMGEGYAVGCLWPEKIKTLTQGFDTATFDGYASVGVLLMDDPLLTACRESKLVDAIKLLLDARMRNGVETIITSQIGTEEDLTDGKEFGEASGSDKERIKALLRRIRETCRIVPFEQPKVQAGQATF